MEARSFNEIPKILTVQDVTGKLQDILILHHIRHLLETKAEILEKDFLDEFAAFKTVHAVYNPKDVIQHIMQTNAKIPDIIQEIIFDFLSGNIRQSVTFSNIMTFEEDIHIICFLYNLKVKHDKMFTTCETAILLKKIMTDKYKIDFESSFTFEKLTVFHVAYSFSSVAWFCDYDNCYETAYFFPCNLPPKIYSGLMPFVLPQLENPPIAIILAIALASNSKKVIPNSLQYLYTRIIKIREIILIPERLKLQLCIQWGIVIMEDKICKFAPCLETNRQNAKDIIATLSRHDEKLHHVLHKI